MSAEQLNLIKRSEEELEKSIKEKREKHGLSVELNADEKALLIKQLHEEQDDRNKSYPH